MGFITLLIGQVPLKSELNELYQNQEEKGRPYLRFLDNEQLSSGIYILEKGAEDLQEPHELDEIYFVLEGDAQLIVEEDTVKINKTDILFVPAYAKHKFINIQSTLKLLVFFSKKEVSSTEPDKK